MTCELREVIVVEGLNVCVRCVKASSESKFDSMKSTRTDMLRHVKFKNKIKLKKKTDMTSNITWTSSLNYFQNR